MSIPADLSLMDLLFDREDPVISFGDKDFGKSDFKDSDISVSSICFHVSYF